MMYLTCGSRYSHVIIGFAILINVYEKLKTHHLSINSLKTCKPVTRCSEVKVLVFKSNAMLTSSAVYINNEWWGVGAKVCQQTIYHISSLL